jgi:tRNA threonylcarbamoyladenosine biosynthesis protein TsaE
MRSLSLVSRSPEETWVLGERLGQLAQAGDVILLTGNLGAGKTCLTQGLARGLASPDHALSPTFMLVRELRGRLPLYHIDLDRLDNLAEITDLGLDEYLYGHGVAVVEWADKGLTALPPRHLLVKIEYAGESERRLQFQAVGARYEKLLAELKTLPLVVPPLKKGHNGFPLS